MRPARSSSGIELYGRIDRIDRRVGDDAPALELIDYKTGSAEPAASETCASRSRTPSSRSTRRWSARETDLPLQAIYLAMDGTRRLEADRARRRRGERRRRWWRASADELRRLRAGAALPPLGEGAACEYCVARGLCRRDHWSPM